MPSQRRSRQRGDEVDRDASRRGHAQTGQQVHAEGRLAERLQDDRRHPAEEHVGREPGRVRGAHQVTYGLELCRVPEVDAGEHRHARGNEFHEGDRGGDPDAPDERHHPSRRLQATPHRLIATDATISSAVSAIPQARRLANRSAPSATSRRAKGATSLLNR